MEKNKCYPWLPSCVRVTPRCLKDTSDRYKIPNLKKSNEKYIGKYLCDAGTRKKLLEDKNVIRNIDLNVKKEHQGWSLQVGNEEAEGYGVTLLDGKWSQ